jgi:hypothetical protein
LMGVGLPRLFVRAVGCGAQEGLAPGAATQDNDKESPVQAVMIARPGATATPSSEIRPEDTPERRLGALLLRMVREADARVPATRRVPRTVAEMRQRIEVRQEGVCPACSGSGGTNVSWVDENGVHRQMWQPCTTCRGSGAS